MSSPYAIRRRRPLGSPAAESPRNIAAMRAQEFWQRCATGPPLAKVTRLGMSFVEAKVVGRRVQMRIKEYEGQVMRLRREKRTRLSLVAKLKSQVKSKNAHIKMLKEELLRRDELDGASPEAAVSLVHQTP